MTREDFADAVAKATRRENWITWVSLAVFFAGMAGLIPLMDVIKPYPWAHIASPMLIFGWIGAFAVYSGIFVRQNANRYDLRCPHCRKHYLYPQRPIMMAGAGNCCFCGKTVFVESAPGPDAKLTSREDFSAGAARAKAGYIRRLIIFMLLLSAIALGGIWGAQSSEGPWVPLFSILFMLAGTIIVTQGYSAWINRRARRNNLQCPHCRRLFLPANTGGVIATGCCCHCGKRILGN